MMRKEVGEKERGEKIEIINALASGLVIDCNQCLTLCDPMDW